MDWHDVKSIKKQMTLPLFIVLIGTVITVMAVAVYKNYQETITRSKVQLDAMTYAEHIKADIMNGISAANTLEEIIVSNNGYINRFSKVAEDMMTDVIQSIQIAPGGAVKEIYPEEENEAGKIDLMNDEDRGEISSVGATAVDAASYLFEIGDSQWKLEVSPTDGWYNSFDLLLLFGAGMIVVLLIAGFEYVLLVQSDYREKAKNEETKMEAAKTVYVTENLYINRFY